MVPKMLRLRSAGHGPNVTAADGRKAAAVTIGGTLVATVALLWAMAQYGRNSYLEALLSISWLVAFVFSQHYTTLKGRPGRVQAVFIGGQSIIVMAIVLTAAWISR